jgi:membrane protein
MFSLLSRLTDRHPWLKTVREVLSFAARRSEEVQLRQVSSSLTLTTVLSLVPLLAVALALFAAFPLFSDYRAAFERYLVSSLLPAEFSSVVLRYLNQFAAKAARLTAFGLAFLAVTALMMIMTIDKALNDIFKVRTRRPLAQRLLIYWALITLGPLLMGLSVSLTSYLASVSSGAIERLPQNVQWLLDVGQLIATAVVFAVLYVFVPYRRVEWKDAMVGGLVAAVLGEGVKSAFTSYISTGAPTSIYGAFAVVPLFIVWVYVSWLITLFGAAITATLPMLRATRFADHMRAGNEFLTAVALLIALLESQRAGQAELDTRTLARKVRCFEDEAEHLLVELERLSYVRQLADRRRESWRLVCDPYTTDVAAVYRRFGVDPDNSLLARDAAAFRGWIDGGLQADWLRQPLMALLPPEPPPQSEQEEPPAAADAAAAEVPPDTKEAPPAAGSPGPHGEPPRRSPPNLRRV